MAVYEFDRFIVLNESGRPAVDAEGNVYAASDNTFTTPLTVTDLSGLPLVLKVDAFGLAPAFQVEHTEPMVVWKSGATAAITLLSVKSVAETGAKADEALATAQTAQTSATAAASSAASAEAAAVALAPDGGAKAVGKGELVVNVKDFGAVGDGVADDTAPVQSAIAAAMAADGAILLPTGTYLVTTGIPNLHALSASGPGAILTGGNTFHPAPSATDVNVLYVSTTGTDTADGLTSSRPLGSLAHAFAVMQKYAHPVLPGLWTVQYAAGTYAEDVDVPEGMRAAGRLTIQGPTRGHPNVPTAILTMGYNASKVGVMARDIGIELLFRDLHFTGYNGTTSSAGVYVSGNTQQTFYENCHFTDCYWGISQNVGSHYDVKGGIFTRCGPLGGTPNTDALATRPGNGGGIRGLMLSRHSIGTQSAGNLTNGPEFRFCATGLYIQEGCTGHLDWTVVEDCVYGVQAQVNSRVNADGTSFKRNVNDVVARAGSSVFSSGNTVYGTGADASGKRVVLTTGAQIVESGFMFGGSDTASYARSEQTFIQEFPAQTITTTSATVIRDVTLKGGTWNQAPGATTGARKIAFVITGSLAGPDSKTLNLRFAGTVRGGLTFAASETGSFRASGFATVTAQGSLLFHLEGLRHLGTSLRIGHGTGTADLTVDQVLRLEGLVGAATSSIVVDSVEVTWM